MALVTSVSASPAGIMMLLPPTESLGAVVEVCRRMEVQIACIGQE